MSQKVQMKPTVQLAFCNNDIKRQILTKFRDYGIHSNLIVHNVNTYLWISDFDQ